MTEKQAPVHVELPVPTASPESQPAPSAPSPEPDPTPTSTAEPAAAHPTVAPVVLAAAGKRKNKGWFVKGDPRINPDGRGRGSKMDQGVAGYGLLRATRADRVMFVRMHPTTLRTSLVHDKQANGASRRISNLPADAEVVYCWSHPRLPLAAVVFRSKSFSRIAKGTPIPEFKAAWDGERDSDTALHERALAMPGRLAKVFMPADFAWIFIAKRVRSQTRTASAVACEFDRQRGGVVFTVASDAFPMVLPGGTIEELPSEFA